MTWLANTILVLHALIVLIVLFIVGGLIAIWIGAALGRSWVETARFGRRTSSP